MIIDLVEALERAIHARRNNTYPDPYDTHKKISHWYNWRDITRRTELVYDSAQHEIPLKDVERLRSYLRVGWMVGPLFCLVFALGRLIMTLCQYLLPSEVSRVCAPVKLYLVKFLIITH